jgi:hypothetical protein
VPRPLCVLDANILIADRKLRGAPAVACFKDLGSRPDGRSCSVGRTKEVVNDFSEAAVAEVRALKRDTETTGWPWHRLEPHDRSLRGDSLQVERATGTDPDVYLIQLYVQADVDVHVTWTKPGSDFTSYGIGHYESQGTTATLWYSVNATYDRIR